MELIWQRIASKRLFEIYLPSSHDSATKYYDFSKKSNVDEQLGKIPVRFLNFLTCGFVGSVISDWGITQNNIIYQQLCDGIRSFDFRITTVDGVNYLHHTWITIKLNEALFDIRKFMGENPKEVLFIYSRIDDPRTDKTTMYDSVSKEIESYLDTISLRYINSSTIHENHPTIENMVSRNQRIYFILESYFTYRSDTSFDVMFQSENILTNVWCDTPSGLSNKDAINYKINYLNEQFKRIITGNYVFVQLTYTITPNNDMVKDSVIKRIFMPWKDKVTLETISYEMHAVYQSFNDGLLGPCIISFDFPSDDLIETVIYNN